MSSRADQKKHNYKLIIDPMIHQRGGQKIYRFDGIDPAVRNTNLETAKPSEVYKNYHIYLDIIMVSSKD